MAKDEDMDVISIHTSTREVTTYFFLPFAFPDFNPHFHKGSDGVRKTLMTDVKISIHTSTREVTGYCNLVATSGLNFNPHFHKGSDNAKAVVFTRH